MARRKFTAADIEINAKDKTKAGVKSAQTGVGKLTSVVKRYGAEMAAVAVVVAGAVRIMKDLTAAYFEQEKAVAGMEAALKATGTYTPELSRNLQDLAGELQKVSVYGDEATIAAAGMLQSLAKLSDDGLMQAIPLVQDLAAGMGLDLVTAASLIGKTLGSTTNALARYGIVLDAQAPASEKLIELTEQINTSFGGMAQAAGETAAGAMTQLTNAIGDLKEAGGEIIATFLVPWVREITTFIEKIIESVKHVRNLRQALVDLKIIDEQGIDAIQDKQAAIERQNLHYAELQGRIDNLLEAARNPLNILARNNIRKKIELLKEEQGQTLATIKALNEKIQAEDGLSAVGQKILNIWTDIYGLPDYPEWLKNLYEATDQAKLDDLWTQMERAQANLISATGEEATMLEAVIKLLREKILAMSEYVDEEERLIGLMDQEGTGGRSYAAMRHAEEYAGGVSYAKEESDPEVESALMSLEEFGEGLEGLAGSVGIVSTLMGGPFSLALKAISIAFGGMMEVQQPLIDSILAPLVGFFKIIGQVLGETLAPMFKIVGDILEALSPVLYLVYVVFKTVCNVVKWFADVVKWVIRFLNPFKRAGRFPSLVDALADVMSYSEFQQAAETAGAEYIDEGDVVSSTQTVTKPPDIYNTFIFNGTFVESSWERFVELISTEQQRQLGLVVIGP